METIEGFTTFYGCGRRGRVIEPHQMFPDTRGDLIGVQALKVPWTSQKTRMREHLECLAIAHGYVAAWLDYRDYQLTGVGQCYQYDVPMSKRGILARFGGKCVRLECAHNGPFRRWVRTGVPMANLEQDFDT